MQTTMASSPFTTHAFICVFFLLMLMFSPEDMLASTDGYEGLPPSVDWRERGAVTRVTDQGNCSSSWAFAALASVEGVVDINRGKLIPLSAQMVVDCDTKSQGCNGGNISNVFEYIIRTGGVDAEEFYPYVGVSGRTCNDTVIYLEPLLDGYRQVPPGDESALAAAVADQPVAVAIRSSPELQSFSGGGIFMGPCGGGPEEVQYMTVVGYGTDEDGTKYWLLKNSLGTKWGEEGYIRMIRGIEDKAGICGITQEAFYPRAWESVN